MQLLRPNLQNLLYQIDGPETHVASANQKAKQQL